MKDEVEVLKQKMERSVEYVKFIKLKLAHVRRQRDYLRGKVRELEDQLRIRPEQREV